MKITELTIKRQASYEEEAGQLRGIVTMTGTTGQTTCVLSSMAIRDIFNCIKREFAHTAKQNAGMVEHAVESAIAEHDLITHEV
jgi:hypothetical protein